MCVHWWRTSDDELGCGAHVAELRRLQVGVFGRDTPMYTLAELERIAADSRSATRSINTAYRESLWPLSTELN